MPVTSVCVGNHMGLEIKGAQMQALSKARTVLSPPVRWVSLDFVSTQLPPPFHPAGRGAPQAVRGIGVGTSLNRWQNNYLSEHMSANVRIHGQAHYVFHTICLSKFQNNVSANVMPEHMSENMSRVYDKINARIDVRICQAPCHITCQSTCHEKCQNICRTLASFCQNAPNKQWGHTK